ncbi:MAG: hypothetical protein O7F56_05490 [Acidobacteria bacterium]|nr:hypothetical protein [Acidobacteriota bacterium]
MMCSPQMRLREVLSVLGAVCLGCAFAGESWGAGGETDGAGFPYEIGSIFENNCLPCHSSQSRMGGLVLETRTDLLKGGAHGAVVAPGDPERSRLVGMLEGKIVPRMPLNGELSATEIEAVKAWIHSGAPGGMGTESLAAAPGGAIPDIQPTVDVSAQVGALAFSSDGRWLAVAGYQNVRVVNPVDRSVVAELSGHAEAVRSVAFSPDGILLAAAGGLPGRWGEVKIWNWQTGELVHTLKGHDDCIYSVAFSPDGKLVATGSYDKLVFLWDVESGEKVKTLKDHIDAVFALAFSADGKWLASAAQDSSVKIWDTDSGERLYTLGEPLESLYTLSFHPSGKRLAAGGVDRVIRVWDLTEKEPTLVQSIIGHEGPILQVAFSPDGERLVTTGEDRTLKVWKAETLTELRVLEEQSDWVMALTFHPLGRWLAVGRYDGSVGLYDAATFEQVAELRAAAE